MSPGDSPELPPAYLIVFVAPLEAKLKTQRAMIILEHYQQLRYALCKDSEFQIVKPEQDAKLSSATAACVGCTPLSRASPFGDDLFPRDEARKHQRCGIKELTSVLAYLRRSRPPKHPLGRLYSVVYGRPSPFCLESTSPLNVHETHPFEMFNMARRTTPGFVVKSLHLRVRVLQVRHLTLMASACLLRTTAGYFRKRPANPGSTEAAHDSSREELKQVAEIHSPRLPHVGSMKKVTR